MAKGQGEGKGNYSSVMMQDMILRILAHSNTLEVNKNTIQKVTDRISEFNILRDPLATPETSATQMRFSDPSVTCLPPAHNELSMAISNKH